MTIYKYAEPIKTLPTAHDLHEVQAMIVAKYNGTARSHNDFHVAACEYMELETLIRAEEKKTED